MKVYRDIIDHGERFTLSTEEQGYASGTVVLTLSDVVFFVDPGCVEVEMPIEALEAIYNYVADKKAKQV